MFFWHVKKPAFAKKQKNSIHPELALAFFCLCLPLAAQSADAPSQEGGRKSDQPVFFVGEVLSLSEPEAAESAAEKDLAQTLRLNIGNYLRSRNHASAAGDSPEFSHRLSASFLLKDGRVTLFVKLYGRTGILLVSGTKTGLNNLGLGGLLDALCDELLRNPAYLASLQEGSGQSGPGALRGLGLFLRAGEGAAFTSAQMRLLYESLVQELAGSGGQIVYEYPPLKAGEDFDPKTALLHGEETYLLVSLSGSMESAEVKTNYFDMKAGIILYEDSRRSSIDPRFRNAVGGLWTPLKESVEANRRLGDRRLTLWFEGPRGAKMWLDGEALPDLDAFGRLRYETPGKARAQLSLYAPGYLPLTLEKDILSDERIELKPEARWPVYFEPGLHWFSYPSLGLVVPLLPDFFEIKVGADFYALGLFLNGTKEGATPELEGFERTSPSLEFRFWFQNPLDLVRVRAGAGFSLNLNHGAASVVDTLTPLTLFVNVGVDLKILNQFGIFFEIMPSFSYSTDPVLLQSVVERIVSERELSQAPLVNTGAVLGPFLFEPFHFRFGLRVQP